MSRSPLDNPIHDPYIHVIMAKKKKRVPYGDGTQSLRNICGHQVPAHTITNKELAEKSHISRNLVAVLMGRNAAEWGMRRVARGTWRRYWKKSK